MTTHDAGHPAPDAHAPEPDRTGLLVAAAWVMMAAGSAFILRNRAAESLDMIVPFLILLLPLLGFVVLALFGDKIRDHGEGQGAAVLPGERRERHRCGQGARAEQKAWCMHHRLKSNIR
jgi:hypothetical protein